MKTGLIITGGGLRGAFSCGVLKQWVDAGMTFSHILGTGFGALMGAYVHAGQGDALENLYNNYMKAHGDDLELFGGFKSEARAVDGLQLLEVADEVDMAAFAAASGRFAIATTRSDNGDGIFWPLERFNEWKHLQPFLRAAVSFPGAAEPVPLVERSYFDGRIAAPLPVTAALEQGCDRLVVVQTKPAIELMKRPILTPSQAMAMRSIPKLRNVYLMSHLHYNDEQRILQQMVRQGKAVVVAPVLDSSARRRYGISMSAVSEYYNEGLRLGADALSKVQALLEANQ